jgi:hypothetical protein
MQRVGNEVIQAFPIKPRTYVGVATGYTYGGCILHAVDKQTVTFDFGIKGVVVVDVGEGQDLSFNDDVISITSTGTVWIS